MNDVTRKVSRINIRQLLSGDLHSLKLALYMSLVVFHFVEHVLQIIQLFVLQWARPESGGLLGLWAPALLKSEVLHFAYNGFQLFGLVVLLVGFAGPARRWWKIALVLQTWHFIEHAVLIIQAQTGTYIYGASKPMSLLEFLLPRIELHFMYNIMVFIPTVAAIYLYWRESTRQQPEAV